MNLKKFFGSLYLGAKGVAGTIRFYGTGGYVNQAFVEFKAPDADFEGMSYTWPEKSNTGLLKNTDGILSWDSNAVYKVHSDSKIENAIPPGYRLIDLIIFNYQSTDIVITIGSTLGGNEFVDGESIAPGHWLEMEIGRYLSPTDYKHLYVSATGWATEGVSVSVDKQYKFIP